MTQPAVKTLSVIIVSYNVRHFLEQALLSVYKALRGIDAEVWVVDNDSADGSLEMVRQRFPQAHAVAAGGNLGFARANNLAIRQCNSRYVLLLNPDTVVEEDTFHQCIAFMDAHPEAGGLGVRMIDGSGQYLPESKRGLPTPWVSFCKMTGLYKLFPRSSRFNWYYMGHIDEQQEAPIEILSGAFMFLRAEALAKSGLLDEAFFMYGEDIDLSYRLVQAGYKNYYLPATCIIHYKGESTKRTSLNYAMVFYEAMLIFARKHFSYRGIHWLEWVIKAGIYVRMGVALAGRIARQMAPVLLDSALIAVGMFFLKLYWETNHKEVRIPYPPDFMQLVVPAYILVWLYAVLLAGGYDRGANASPYVRGVVIGTVVISAVTNFFDNYRFSKALILLGSAWTLFAMLGWRLVVHFIRYRNLDLGSEAKRRVVFIGKKIEAERTHQLLLNSEMPHSWLGYASTTPPVPLDDDYLGSIDRLSDLIICFRPDELIFSAEDLPSSQIIQIMMETAGQQIAYKIVPDDSAFIIGSDHKNSQGDLYSVPLELRLMQPAQRRSKRALDVILAVVFVLLAPILLWFVDRPLGFLQNIGSVITGMRSWVGLAQTGSVLLRPGVLTPASAVHPNQIDDRTIRRLEALYAKDYSVTSDINIILSAFKELGNR